MHNRRTSGKVRRIAIRHAKSKGGQELKWAIEAEMKDRDLEWDEAIIKNAIDRALYPDCYRRPHPSLKWS